MQTLYDYKKFAILYVDDEEKSLKTFARLFGEQFRVLTAANAQQGYELLQAHQDEIGLLMTDQRMPGEKGVWLLEKARQLRPRVIRILVTAYSDLDAAVQAVNTGAIYKYLTKPWEVPHLEMTLKRALEFFMVQRERDQLLQEKMSTLHKLVITDRVISLGVLAAGLGHHVRNALVAVRTFIDLAPEMLDREDLDMEALRYPNFWTDFYKKVQAKMRQIVRLLDDLEEAAEKPSFEFLSEVALSDVIDQVLEKAEPQFEAKEIVIDRQFPPNLPRLWVDERKFFRLFDLLFQDELLTLPPGSNISLSARPVTFGPMEIKGLELCVRDNGPGLPADALRSVFDPFFVRVGDPQEFGINLLACYFIIFHHGGQVQVKADPGQGVAFVITLPINPKSLPRQQDEEEFLTKVMLNERLWEKLLATA
ncbi:MAG: response regulator [Verrucomicrobia bacterium]|nr:response regulator [Verrucomicrobiota bacterium]